MAIINGVEKTFQQASRPYQENLCPQGYRSEFLAEHIPRNQMYIPRRFVNISGTKTPKI